MKRIPPIGIVFLISSLVLSLLTGCTTDPSRRSSGTRDIKEPTSASSGEAGITAVESVAPTELMRDLTPQGSQPLFFGVANRLQNRDEELDAAILHVAEQASRYVRIRASYQFISERNTNSIGYLDNIDTMWDTEFADSLVESVEILQEQQDNAGTYILATVEGVPAAPAISGVQPSSGGEPSWVNNPPVIPGYLTAVGVINPSRRFRDSLDRVDQEALKGLLQQTGTTIRMIEDRRDEERRGTQMQVTTAQEANATLRGFYVLARYATQDKRYFYSLAIAREE